MITGKLRYSGTRTTLWRSGDHLRALFFRSIRTLCLAWLLLCSHSGCLQPLPPLSTGFVSGVVVSTTPIKDATVQFWVVNGLGRALSLQPVASTITGENGEFEMQIDLDAHREFVDAPFLLLNAYFVPPDAQSGQKPFHLWLLIPGQHPIGPYDDLVVSPLTTMAMTLGDARLAQGKAATYAEAMEQAHRLLGEHFHIPDITRRQWRDVASPFNADMYYSLVLHAMSSLAEEMYQDADEVLPGYELFPLIEALLADALGPDAIFDGIGPDGLPVALASCAPECQLNPDTLRTDLVSAVARDYLRSPESAGVNFGDAASLLLSIASSTEPELFGDTLPDPLDVQAPEIEALPSEMFDEEQDIITFADQTMVPRHIHDGETIDLASGFGGDPCPEVYKHVNRMDASQDDNPLRWRFAINDDVVGVDDASVTATVHVVSTDEEFPATIQRVGVPASGSMQYELVVQRDQVPALHDTEGMFVLDIEASDWLGNTAPASACWIHHPLAPPLWVSPPRLSEGADSLASLTLASDDNNLAALLNGAPLDLGAEIMEFEVRNGTDEPAYVTLDYSQPSTLYSKSWTDTFAPLYQLTDTSCITDMTCTTDINLPIRDFQSLRGTIAELITGIRVWDSTYMPPIEIFMCEECDPDEYRLEPRVAEDMPRSYRVVLVTTYLPELAPRESDEPPMVFVDAPIHPAYQPVTITGIIGQTRSVCTQLDIFLCRTELVLQSYRALTEVSITASLIEVRGQMSAAPDLSLHVPRPSANTFGRPLRVPELQWFTLEDVIPPPPQL